MIEDDLARKKAKEAEKAKDKDKKKSPKPQRRVVDAAAISPRRFAQMFFNKARFVGLFQIYAFINT